MSYKNKKKGHIKGKYNKIYNYEDAKKKSLNFYESAVLAHQSEKNGYENNKTKEKKDEFETFIWDKPFLRSLEWKRYEEICMEFLRIKNCSADVTCIGADGGIDIKVKDNNGVVFAVAQCKSWAKVIGVSLIRELYGVMAADRVKLGIFLTTSDYSKEALEFAKNKNLLLIDGDELIRLINEMKENDKKRMCKIATEGDYTTPTCVNCNVKMVRRVSPNTGKDFWGCVNFPKCRRTMFVKS